MVVKRKVKRTSRTQLVDEYISRIASGKPTKRIEKKLAKTKEGRRLKAKYNRKK